MFALGASALVLAACSEDEKTPEVQTEVEESATDVDTEETETASEVDDALAELRAALEDREKSDEPVPADDSGHSQPEHRGNDRRGCRGPLYKQKTRICP